VIPAGTLPAGVENTKLHYPQTGETKGRETMADLMDNEASRSLTDRERELLVTLVRCLRYLADLNGSNWIDGDNVGSIDMRQRAKALQRLAKNTIDADLDLYMSVYGEA
jgi:hypothetical protein